MTFKYLAWTRYPRSKDARIVIGDAIRVAFSRDGATKTSSHDVAGNETLLRDALDRDNAEMLSVAEFESRFGVRTQS